MKRRITFQALAASAFAVTLLLFGGCSTTESRIAERPQAYSSLSPSDQALVTRGEIREGMSRDAVYIAWGAPNQRGEGRNRGQSVETWVYFNTTSGDSFGYGYGYGLGFGGRFGYLHGGHGFYPHSRFFYDPFYDPFFWSNNRIITYPDRTVSFQNGRVIAYQYLPAPRVF